MLDFTSKCLVRTYLSEYFSTTTELPEKSNQLNWHDCVNAPPIEFGSTHMCLCVCLFERLFIYWQPLPQSHYRCSCLMQVLCSKRIKPGTMGPVQNTCVLYDRWWWLPGGVVRVCTLVVNLALWCLPKLGTRCGRYLKLAASRIRVKNIW